MANRFVVAAVLAGLMSAGCVCKNRGAVTERREDGSTYVHRGSCSVGQDSVILILPRVPLTAGSQVWNVPPFADVDGVAVSLVLYKNGVSIVPQGGGYPTTVDPQIRLARFSATVLDASGKVHFSSSALDDARWATRPVRDPDAIDSGRDVFAYEVTTLPAMGPLRTSTTWSFNIDLPDPVAIAEVANEVQFIISGWRHNSGWDL